MKRCPLALALKRQIFLVSHQSTEKRPNKVGVVKSRILLGQLAGVVWLT